LQGPQTPGVPGIDATHDVPGQQSASLVQPPQADTHAAPEHTKVAPASPAPGTHGAPLQQLALDAHAPPAETHCAGAQRGTPTLSCRQVSSVSQFPLQQSQDELHEALFSLHTSPSGLHPIGLRHTPTVAGAVITQVTGIPEPPGSPAEPQQSLSVTHRSPTTWHPLAGWQTSTPLGPHGAHARLQHGPPHAGSPASGAAPVPLVPVPPQSCPSTTPQLAGPDGGEVPQVPSVCPDTMAQVPVQQSVAAAHESPACPQNDDGWHVPPMQRPEQQSALAEHALPSVLHFAFNVAQVPALHCWLQQSPSDAQLEPSVVQAG
jgi:hypothetical protein